MPYIFSFTNAEFGNDRDVDIIEALLEALTGGNCFRLVERGGEFHLVEAR